MCILCNTFRVQPKVHRNNPRLSSIRPRVRRQQLPKAARHASPCDAEPPVQAKAPLQRTRGNLTRVRSECENFALARRPSRSSAVWTPARGAFQKQGQRVGQSRPGDTSRRACSCIGSAGGPETDAVPQTLPRLGKAPSPACRATGHHERIAQTR